MAMITLTFHDQDNIPALLEREAANLGITTEQLVKRYICEAVRDLDPTGGLLPGETLSDYLARHDVRLPTPPD